MSCTIRLFFIAAPIWLLSLSSVTCKAYSNDCLQELQMLYLGFIKCFEQETLKDSIAEDQMLWMSRCCLHLPCDFWWLILPSASTPSLQLPCVLLELLLRSLGLHLAVSAFAVVQYKIQQCHENTQTTLHLCCQPCLKKGMLLCILWCQTRKSIRFSCFTLCAQILLKQQSFCDGKLCFQVYWPVEMSWMFVIFPSLSATVVASSTPAGPLPTTTVVLLPVCSRSCTSLCTCKCACADRFWSEFAGKNNGTLILLKIGAASEQ